MLCRLKTASRREAIETLSSNSVKLIICRPYSEKMFFPQPSTVFRNAEDLLVGVLARTIFEG